jgi:hypothetical protein
MTSSGATPPFAAAFQKAFDGDEGQAQIDIAARIETLRQ